ncbi:hypothetical protein CCMA1212_001195 [Trichoderma ghanense]|uniref:Uncharacterized protein n=1 Tax=Trichoderma ghanense TaxID=65468 RepID=A0ABY2HGS8_9HYPO
MDAGHTLEIEFQPQAAGVFEEGPRRRVSVLLARPGSSNLSGASREPTAATGRNPKSWSGDPLEHINAIRGAAMSISTEPWRALASEVAGSGRWDRSGGIAS